MAVLHSCGRPPIVYGTLVDFRSHHLRLSEVDNCGMWLCILSPSYKAIYHKLKQARNSQERYADKENRIVCKKIIHKSYSRHKPAGTLSSSVILDREPYLSPVNLEPLSIPWLLWEFQVLIATMIL